MAFFDDFADNVFNPFISSVGSGLNTGFQTVGQVAGSTLASALPVWTAQTLQGQSFDKLAKPTFNRNFAPPRIEDVGAKMTGPLGFAGELDTTTIVLLGVVVIGGLIAAVKL